MRKAELRNFLFERFQTRATAIKQRFSDFLADFESDANAFISEYGDVAQEVVRELFVAATNLLHSPKTRKAKTEALPQEAKTTTKASEIVRKRIKKHRRKRTPRKLGQPTILEVLRKSIPAFLAQVGADGKEFTTRQVFEAMEKVGLPDKRVNHANVSLYLSQHGKEHGLKSEIRKIKRRPHKGKPLPPVETRFFHISRRRVNKEAQTVGRATRRSLSLAKDLATTEFKGKAFTPAQMATSLKKNYGIVLRNVHATVGRLRQLGAIKRVGKGQYQA